ncbi:integral membrane protein GPR155-like isoform X1 [Portunus trituberculatus]|uniref:integral membrane protein GPR155-like isoform X1 n=2 Tax=Portunus trituberculatus TaxID=210409 RepID=UPI001E1CC10A|nr:integral membrane protein GPR155-like isoform X1 [Portunus trituberculatus]
MQVQVVAIVTVVVGLVGLCVVKEITNPASHHHNINMALCREVFHYGVFDLPLPCRLRLHGPSVANLETEVNLGEGESYGQLEYLTMTTTTTTTAAAAAGEGDGGGGAGGLFSGEDVAFSNLYPAVMECFVIILCGYLAGRCNLISQNEAKGLNTFVGTFALPSLIFLSMAKLDFSAVNWAFLVSICVSKSVVFAVVVVVTLLVYKPVDLGRAGLFAIFCTQSNDFALGYPIVAALYGKTHPEFASYLYLVAPISLVLLNPVGFVLMEIGKRRRRADDSSGSNSEGAAGQQAGCKLALFIAKDVFLNPIVLMTTLGIVGNFLFTHTLPTILEGILKVLGQSFSATALFLLGLRMVGKVQTLKGSGLVVPGILIATKTLILPLVTREVVTLLQPGTSANETVDFSNYGFLYGTFPTAPGVFVFATQYNVAVDLMASAMVACTFLSAPLMFVSAKMVTLVHINPSDYVKELEAILLNVSIVGLVSTVWVLFVFILSKKWRKVPHFFTMCLTISQCVACIGALMWSVLECSHTWKLYLQFILFSWGVFAARLWTAILAVTLFLLRWRSLCFVLRLRPFLCVLGWGLPAVVVTILVLMVQQETEVGDKHDPNFQYGAAQAVVALLLLWFSLFTTMVCLILHQRHEKRYAQYESLLHMDDGDSRASPPPSQRTSATDLPRLECGGVASSLVLQEDKLNTKLEETLSSSDSDSLFSPDDDLNSCRGRSSRGGGGGSSGGEEDSGMGGEGVARFPLTEPEETGIVRDRDDEFQMMRHVVLLLLLCGSMIVGFALCMWTLVTEEVNGVYIELVFLDIVLNFGQGFFTAAIFGLDTRLVLVPLLRWWRRCRGLAEVVVPRWEELDPVTRQTCDQFTSYHMDKCVKDIVRDRRWRLQNLTSVFIGKELVDWLILVGLASDRTEAVKYGRRLLQGGIICHLRRQHHFHDQALFYSFRGAGLSTGQ